MKMGADRKRTMILGALVLVGGYLLWSNVFSSDASATASTGSVAAAGSAPLAATPARLSDAARMAARRSRSGQRVTQWTPGMDSGAAVNPEVVDPTLRLDLLAKVQQVEVSGAQRNLFQFGDAVQPPKPLGPLPQVKNIPMGPKPTPLPSAPATPAVPTAPPIALKYYGYSSPKASAHKRAFFLDGEDIIVASEGELIKRRYRLVKIGVNSVTVEDTQFKTEQTLPLAEELAG